MVLTPCSFVLYLGYVFTHCFPISRENACQMSYLLDYSQRSSESSPTQAIQLLPLLVMVAAILNDNVGTAEVRDRRNQG